MIYFRIAEEIGSIVVTEDILGYWSLPELVEDLLMGLGPNCLGFKRSFLKWWKSVNVTFFFFTKYESRNISLLLGVFNNLLRSALPIKAKYPRRKQHNYFTR